MSGGRRHVVRELDDWLRTRRPEPPADLRGRVLDSVREREESLRELESVREQETASQEGMPEPVSMSEGSAPPEPVASSGARSRMERLLDAAGERLDAARARPGRDRVSAFELLVADALVTYACEAALETEDPATALEAIAEVGRRQ